jgi:hypothetical protein
MAFDTSNSLFGSYAYHDKLKGVCYGAGCVRTTLPKLLSLLDGSEAFIVSSIGFTMKGKRKGLSVSDAVN